MRIDKRYIGKLVEIVEVPDGAGYQWAKGQVAYVYDIGPRYRAVFEKKIMVNTGDKVYMVSVDHPKKHGGYALGIATKVRLHKCSKDHKHLCLIAPQVR